VDIEQTLAIIKPDSVAAGQTGRILACLEDEGFQILALEKRRLSEAQARAFYEVHRARPFYDSLVQFMTSGPVVAVAVGRENAVRRLREVMGATNPAEAAKGTIREIYGSSIERNAIHGSDSPENAVKELAFFFPNAALVAARS
jgi:nucleoside-diphosphate kinase